jgi:hypothetical protein
VILRALASSPDDRWASAAELQAALERAMTRSNLTASTSDVAMFVGEHLAEHAAARRRMIETATQAAAARAAGQPAPSDLDGPRANATSSTEIMAVSAGSHAWPLHGTPTGTSPVPAPSSSGRGIGGRIEVDVGSSGGGSLGLGSVASSVVAPSPGRNRGVVFTVLGIGGVLAGIGVVLIGTSLRAKSAASRIDAPPPATSLATVAAGTVSAPASESASASEAPIAAARVATTAHAPAAAAPPTPATPTPTPKTTTVAVAATPKAPPAPVVKPPPASTGKRKKIDDGF